jgi:hypothetical protein
MVLHLLCSRYFFAELLSSFERVFTIIPDNL